MVKYTAKQKAAYAKKMAKKRKGSKTKWKTPYKTKKPKKAAWRPKRDDVAYGKRMDAYRQKGEQSVAKRAMALLARKNL